MIGDEMEEGGGGKRKEEEKGEAWRGKERKERKDKKEEENKWLRKGEERGSAKRRRIKSVLCKRRHRYVHKINILIENNKDNK